MSGISRRLRKTKLCRLFPVINRIRLAGSFKMGCINSKEAAAGAEKSAKATSADSAPPSFRATTKEASPKHIEVSVMEQEAHDTRNVAGRSAVTMSVPTPPEVKSMAVQENVTASDTVEPKDVHVAISSGIR